MPVFLPLETYTPVVVQISQHKQRLRERYAAAARQYGQPVFRAGNGFRVSEVNMGEMRGNNFAGRFNRVTRGN